MSRTALSDASAVRHGDRSPRRRCQRPDELGGYSTSPGSRSSGASSSQRRIIVTISVTFFDKRRAGLQARRKSAAPPCRAPRILIIEDEQDVIDLLTLHLRKAGFTLITATDGASGLRKAREESPALIILDLMLPKMPGLEICKVLKTDAATRHIPIIMLTAKAEEIDRIVGLEFGADDYVTKPFSPRELVLRVNAILRRGKGEVVEEKNCRSARSRSIRRGTTSPWAGKPCG